MSNERAKPTQEQYEQAALGLRLSHAPRCYPCAKCGWPVIDGYCCNYCGDTDPRQPIAGLGNRDDRMDY